MEFTKELIEKAKACKTAEELLSLAKENEIELTKEDAEAILGEFSEDELSDEELDNVAAGAEGCGKPFNGYERICWKKKEDVQFIFREGDIVQAKAFCCRHHTATCKVVNRRIASEADGYYDQYWLERESGDAPFMKSWYFRSVVEK